MNKYILRDGNEYKTIFATDLNEAIKKTFLLKGLSLRCEE